MKQDHGAARGLGRDHPIYQTFATLDRRSLKRFLELGIEVAVAAGHAVMAAGSAVDAFYLVINGRLAVEREGQRLRELQAGEFFGERALFSAEPPIVTIRALGPATLLRITRDAAIDYIALYPQFGANFCALLVRENLARLTRLGEVYIANRALTEQLEAKNDNLRHAIITVEQTARLVSQSPNPVLRIASSGLLLFANGPAEPILGHWRCAIGASVPESWRDLVRDALAAGHPHTLESAIGDGVFVMTVMPMPDLGYANVYGQDMTETRRKAALIEHMALHDDLTGLPNRAALRERLDATVARADRRQAALILIDVDGLEPIRALFGHPVSDTLLIDASRRLDAIAGASDLVAALGGNQFAVLLEGTDDEASATRVVETIIERLSTPFEIDSHRLQIGVHAGIALIGGTSLDSSEHALMRADLAKHQVGSTPGPAYGFYRPDLEQALRERHRLEIELHSAIGTDQIDVVFQPKVRIADGRIIGAEALVRWRHPTRGTVLPDRFIPIAEQTGAIRALGEQVLRLACRTAAGWARDDLHVAVNLSALQLRQADITERVAAILAETGLAPHRLELEITESLLVEDTERAVDTLERLRALGVRLSLDDFGTGYSCLSYLARLKFDKLKIDRSFVVEMHRSPDMRKLAKTIVRLGASLEMAVVAEGIELPEQWQHLRELGCAEGQGYLFSPPLTGAELAAALAASPELPARHAHGRVA
ncbi:MAG: EAL domain-containing protein [Proteobacteria bacterium]|nr:EAL domain-containing protein [Pseudomonadota bacterium]